MKTINPATGEIIKEYDLMEEQTLDDIVCKASVAQERWRGHSFHDRSSLLKNAADILKEKKSKYAELMTREMGKPIEQAESEIEKCAWVCNYYADNAEDFLTDDHIKTDAEKSYVAFEPMGVVLAIMPWNFPFWQVFRFAAPALMAGNGAVLSHSSNVTGCALAIEELLHEAGILEELFRTVITDDDHTQSLITHPEIAAVTLTGSTRAGKAVASTAGEELKKTVLELGGSDPYLILKDADIELAAEKCVTSRLLNSGQSCIAAKRWIVVEDVYDRFLDAVKSRMESRKMGDPFDRLIDIGPIAREDLRDTLHQQVTQSIEAGAKCIMGGELPDRKGYFYPPTILTNISEGMPAYEEELFGPVASVFEVADEEEAIRIANDNKFGLGAAVFSEDIERAEDIAVNKLRAGNCFVNDFVKSDPRLPFGGIKKSGYGRELSHYGIREFVNIKTISIA